MDKFQILNKLLKEMYVNKVDAKITIKGLIALLDEVEEIFDDYDNQIDKLEKMKEKFKVKFNNGK